MKDTKQDVKKVSRLGTADLREDLQEVVEQAKKDQATHSVELTGKRGAQWPDFAVEDSDNEE